MINKRLLIKSLLSKNDENSFYDKKQKLSLQSREGKAKFVKHVCALSNSNPDNNSYIVIGVQDEENKIIGVDFFDDSKIQNLVIKYMPLNGFGLAGVEIQLPSNTHLLGCSNHGGDGAVPQGPAPLGKKKEK